MVFSTSSLWEGRAGRWFISTTTGEGISQPSATSGSQCSWCSSLQTFSSSTITLCWTSSISSCKNWPSKIVIIWNRIYLFTTYFQFKIVDRERNIWSYQKYDFSIWVVNTAWDCRGCPGSHSIYNLTLVNFSLNIDFICNFTKKSFNLLAFVFVYMCACPCLCHCFLLFWSSRVSSSLWSIAGKVTKSLRLLWQLEDQNIADSVTYWAVLDSSKNWRTYCKLRTEVYLLVTFFLVLDKSINREP